MKRQSVENETEEILDELSQEFSVVNERYIREQLSSEIETEQRNIHRHLRRNNPFRENQVTLSRAENELETKDTGTIEQIEQDFRHFQALAKQTNSRIGEKYWLSEFQKLIEDEEHQAKLQNFVKKYEPSNRNKEGNDLKKAHEEQVICRKLLQQQWR